MPRRLPRSCLLAAALLTSSTAALADTPPSSEPSEPAPARAATAPPSSHASVLAALQAPEPAPRASSSYYAAIGITETFVGLLYVGTGTKGPQIAGTMLSLAVPVVHAAHGNGRRGFLSLGLRLGLAWAGHSLAGGDGNNCHNAPYCPDTAGAIGFAAGYVAAAIIDYAFLCPDPRRKPPARWWAPTAAAAPGGASIGVVGGF